MSYHRDVPFKAYSDRNMCQRVTADQLSNFRSGNGNDDVDDNYDRTVRLRASNDEYSDIDGEPMETPSSDHESKRQQRRSCSRSQRQQRGSFHNSEQILSIEKPDYEETSNSLRARRKITEHYTSERPDSRLAASEPYSEWEQRRQPKFADEPRWSCSREEDIRVTENYITVKNNSLPDAKTKEPDPPSQQNDEKHVRVKKRKRHSSRSKKSHRVDSCSETKSKKRKRRRHSQKKSKRSRGRRSERAASMSSDRGRNEKKLKSPCLPMLRKRRRRQKRISRSVSPPPLLVEHVDPEEEAKQKQENMIRLAKMKASIVRQAVQLKLQQAKRKEENNEDLNNKKTNIHSMFTVTDSPQESHKPTKTGKKLYLPRSRLVDDHDRHRGSSRRSYSRRSPERSRRYRRDWGDVSRRPPAPSPSPPRPSPPVAPPKPKDMGILNAICHLAEHVVKKDPTIEKKIYDKNIESRGGKNFRFLYEPDSVAGKYYAFLKQKLQALKKKL
jgi:hypothetical protein